MIKVGKKIPAFSLPMSDGSKWKTADVLSSDGKHGNLVLYFYPKDMTPGCTLEGQDFRDLHAAFKRAKTTVLGISKDSCERHANRRILPLVVRGMLPVLIKTAACTRSPNSAATASRMLPRMFFRSRPVRPCRWTSCRMSFKMAGGLGFLQSWITSQENARVLKWTHRLGDSG